MSYAKKTLKHTGQPTNTVTQCCKHRAEFGPYSATRPHLHEVCSARNPEGPTTRSAAHPSHAIQGLLFLVRIWRQGHDNSESEPSRCKDRFVNQSHPAFFPPPGHCSCPGQGAGEAPSHVVRLTQTVGWKSWNDSLWGRLTSCLVCAQPQI